MAAQTASDARTGTPEPVNITLIGAGTIGLSFAALHLYLNPNATITIYDTRPDLSTYITTHLPAYLTSLSTPSNPAPTIPSPRLRIATTLAEAASTADIIQEQGPENLTFKAPLWPQLESLCPQHTLFWSSTSGIPASAQSASMSPKGAARLLVVHPYNPPHIMPLLELVPSPLTSEDAVSRSLAYWRALGRTPVLLRKECKGFVANRLAMALFREAASLVDSGVVSVRDLDDVMTSSMGPRWAVQGVFKSYHAGGGAGGLGALMRNVGGTIRESWAESEKVAVEGPGGREGWEERIVKETEEAYGTVDTAITGRRTQAVLRAAAGEGEKVE